MLFFFLFLSINTDKKHIIMHKLYTSKNSSNKNMATNMILISLLEQDEVDILIDNEENTMNLDQILVDIPRKGDIKTIEGVTLSWSKSLEHLPVFTINEIEKHKQLTGKMKGKHKGLPITKTLIKGRKLMQDGYLKTNEMFACSTDEYFKVKCKCLASMKSVLRDIVVTLDVRTSEVVKVSCSCPAGQSGYCNHVMALLLKLASFSLQGTTEIPEEVACTSIARQWGVQVINNFRKLL